MRPLPASEAKLLTTSHGSCQYVDSTIRRVRLNSGHITCGQAQKPLIRQQSPLEAANGPRKKQIFSSKESLREALNEYAFKNNFCLRTIKSDRGRVVLGCRFEECSFRARSAADQDNGQWPIRTLEENHSGDCQGQCPHTHSKAGKWIDQNIRRLIIDDEIPPVSTLATHLEDKAGGRFDYLPVWRCGEISQGADPYK